MRGVEEGQDHAEAARVDAPGLPLAGWWGPEGRQVSVVEEGVRPAAWLAVGEVERPTGWREVVAGRLVWLAEPWILPLGSMVWPAADRDAQAHLAWPGASRAWPGAGPMAERLAGPG